MREFNYGVYNAVQGWPAEWRPQVFTAYVRGKDTIEVTTYLVVDDVRLRHDYEIAPGGLDKTSFDFTEQEGKKTMQYAKLMIDADIADDVVERVRNGTHA